MKDIDRKYRIVAGAPNVLDVIELLQAVADGAADIREHTGKHPLTIEARQSALTILQSMIDRLRSARDNGAQRARPLIDEDS